MGKRIVVGFLVVGLVAASCSDDDNTTSDGTTPNDTAATTAPSSDADQPDPEPGGTEPPATDPATTDAPSGSTPTDGTDGGGAVAVDEPIDATILGGVEQITLLDAQPGAEFVLVPDDDFDATLAAGVADEYGSLVVRELDPDIDYRVGDGQVASVPIDVLDRDEHPDSAFYAEQRLELNPDGNTGFDYIETRDGTTLGAYIVLPGPIADGPYPTVVEYSGYSPSNPNQGPGFPTLFTSLGYAYVGVNMRGTGCSGGSFRYFEYTQSTDGYDAIEAVAAQPWVQDNAVGMVGISYPGISQLFVARTQPPSLKAITPVSVTDDSYNGTLYPGGILNTGFAVSWTQDRIDSARPSITPDGEPTAEGQGWSYDEIAAGDETCAANQRVRDQNPDLVAEIDQREFYDPAVADELAARTFVDQIEVPTFLAGAWQDEQTGGRFPTMIDRFTGTEHLYVSLLNGLHTESISPAVLPRLVEFLDLYVAERVPDLGPIRAIGPVLAEGIYGTAEIGDPPDRFAGLSYDEALTRFEAEPEIEVHFEQGAADGFEPLTPLPRFTERFESWPIPSTEPTVWHLGASTLSPEPTVEDGRVDYRALPLPDVSPATYWTGNSSDLWRTDVVWDWQQPQAGFFSDFRTEPLTETVTMVGSGSADLWVAAGGGNTDLEVTLTELRPDGTEVLVQSGWLRASHRALDDAVSTDLRPVHTHAEADAEPLPDPGDGSGNLDLEATDAFVLARVEVFPFAHVFRAGSQIRLLVDAPGGNRAVWEFDTISDGEQVQIGVGPSNPSRVVLPVIPGIDPPAEYPACDSLRGQPCRPATP